ncbi:MAG: DUF423 domain-containing protein [Balneola sp.]|nr:DUF423 domain-containing protein [Balneola sp.]MBO6651257.1 DUF423 domain-containing protein [Balneola sp.]MBO6712052.1 DUF423 domain-containing protein [Balneola sp.]MBO6800246.1 DUF423 domain-containing protein [Balneola sp.]MBO6869740.1 DUF423 domain-containing protein [Balneola sp.]
MSNYIALISGSLLLATGIGAGAFGAHALENTLTSERLETWKTAVDYQVWNAIGLLLIALVSNSFGLELNWSKWLIFSGVLIFSGSLYILCLTDTSWLGAITPIGGVCLILGWILFTIHIIKNHSLIS